MSDSDAYSGEYSYDEPSSNGYSNGGGGTSDEDSYQEPVSNACGDGDSEEDYYNGPSSNACGDGASDEGEDSYNNTSTYSYCSGNSGRSYYKEPSSGTYHGHTSRTRYDDNQVVGYGQPRGSQQSKVRELTSRFKNEDQQTGAYERVTMKERMSRGETHFEKSTGRYGIADGYRNSTTIKVGDRSGYTEYYHEDRVRRVNYDGTSSSRLRQGNKITSISVDCRGAGIQKNSTHVSVSHGKNKSTSLSITSRGKHR